MNNPYNGKLGIVNGNEKRLRSLEVERFRGGS